VGVAASLSTSLVAIDIEGSIAIHGAHRRHQRRDYRSAATDRRTRIRENEDWRYYFAFIVN
jgi:hypothetical protein